MAGRPNDAAAPTYTVSREITEKLSRRVVSGAYPVGTKLPTERDLAQEFGVTRHVVREALKRLEAVQLVSIRQGSGIYVRDLQLTAGAELFDVLLTREDGGTNLDFLRDILEFRDQIMRVVVRLAAMRRTDAEMEALLALVRARREAMNDAAQREALNAQIFKAIVRATHNQIHELLFNTMGRVHLRLRAQFDVPLLGLEQTQQALERIVEAIQQGDPDMAELLTVRHVESIRNALFGDESAATV